MLFPFVMAALLVLGFFSGSRFDTAHMGFRNPKADLEVALACLFVSSLLAAGLVVAVLTSELWLWWLVSAVVAWIFAYAAGHKNVIEEIQFSSA